MKTRRRFQKVPNCKLATGDPFDDFRENSNPISRAFQPMKTIFIRNLKQVTKEVQKLSEKLKEEKNGIHAKFDAEKVKNPRNSVSS